MGNGGDDGTAPMLKDTQQVGKEDVSFSCDNDFSNTEDRRLCDAKKLAIKLSFRARMHRYENSNLSFQEKVSFLKNRTMAFTSCIGSGGRGNNAVP